MIDPSESFLSALTGTGKLLESREEVRMEKKKSSPIIQLRRGA